MGLIIGLAGLGIMTIRSIHERKSEIGVMRAIGYRRRMVVVNFALESTLVAALGIIIGTLLGIVTGYRLWLGSFHDVTFEIPWATILFVAVGSLAITLVSIFPAARGASRVCPAEVLRSE
jgi:putative ABC transport system permease protein